MRRWQVPCIIFCLLPRIQHQHIPGTYRRPALAGWFGGHEHIALAFNHLFAGLEAYVSAHLWDFPTDLEIQATAQGIGASVSLPPLR